MCTGQHHWWHDNHMTTSQTILVTGGSGFIAGHFILQFAERGFPIRATICSLAKEQQVRGTLSAAGLPDTADLTFVAADLTDDAGWAEACAGVDTVLHVASPVMPGHVKNEDDVITPAREGTLRVLRAAIGAGLRRVVLTSAFHAIGFGHPRGITRFTDDMWSPLNGPGMDAYGRSKVLAERAAWDFAAETGLELTSMCPVAVMGPIMGRSITGSNQMILGMLTGKMPVIANVAVPTIDVGDVAAAHVAAINTPEAAGKRFLLSDGQDAIPLREISALLRSRFGDAAAKAPTRALPDWLVKALARVVPPMREIAPDLGRVKQPSNERAREVLGFDPRPAREAVTDAAASRIDAGLTR